ncbi:MAG: DUF5686 and carboxypeptidase regulatory-like domain-containing protein [Imperialibacter sp.]|uniref:DUF5686 and carboxypeptidase regulatory-like domain-containing protein n=1 Tax=Imperialibacter sp. TaxID=2038411 RepID=UPI003A8C3279
MTKFSFLAFLIVGVSLLIGGASYAQSIKGIVIDEKGEPLPFTTIYVGGTSTGVSTNQDGDYELSLAPGPYDIVFQYVGYKRQIQEVVVIPGKTYMLNVQLLPEAYQLREVVVNSKDRDPAYAVIREAIRKRKYHLTEVNAFSCRVYIKGNQHLDDIPNSVLGYTVPLDTGIVYLSESVSDLSYIYPDKYSERMISSRVSGQSKAFSFNMASEMYVNFYNNLLGMEGLTERGFVSPIASNAFFFYDYKLRGAFQEGDYLINKIEVIPKRANDPVFSGFIYIVEDSWSIHSIDLVLPQKKQIEFVDSLRIRQQYAPLDQGIWMMLSQRFDFRIGAFGFHGNGYFVGVYSNYKIEPRYKLDAVNKLTGPTVEQVDTLPKNDVKLFPKPKKSFGKEVLVIEEDANKREDVYWEKIRPIPLNDYEKKDYKIKDSLLVIKESKPFKDSMDDKRNNLNLVKLFVSGYRYNRSYKRDFLSFDPLIKAIQYNTVEGVVTNLDVNYTRYYENNKFYRITPAVRYGFSSGKLYGRLGATYYYDPKKFSSAQVDFGQFVYQFNQADPIVSYVNTAETLVGGRNLIKLFEKTYVSTRYRTELWNGVLFTGRFSWEKRVQLYNTSFLSILKEENRIFTPNAPKNLELADTSFPTHEAAIVDLSIIYHPGQRYISRPDQKVLLVNKWPSFTFNYVKGLNGLLGSDVDYDRVSAKISDEISQGLFGMGRLTLESGFFPGKKVAYFMDYRQFNGNATLYARFEPGNFQLLDYYLYSSLKPYFMGQYEHHFDGFIVNKLPLLRKTKLQAVGSVNYLRAGTVDNYVEIGIGLEHILKILRVDFYTSFIGREHQAIGFKGGLGF